MLSPTVQTEAATTAAPQPAPAETPAPAPSPAPPPAATVTTATTTTVAPKPTATTTVTKIAAAPVPASPAETQLTLVMRTTFTNVGTTEVRSGHVDVPLLSYTRGSTQEVLSESITPAPIEVREDALGNRIGRFSLAEIPAGGTLVIRQEYRITMGPTAGNRLSMDPRPEHLMAEAKVEVDAPEIRALAAELARGGGDSLALARRIAERTLAIKYDAHSPARNQGALAALKSGSGVCEEYATLFTALARAAGLPARVVHGFARDRDSARSAWSGVADTAAALATYRHAWAEVYIEGRGWLAVDPTYNRGELGSGGMGAIAPGTFIIEGYANSPVSGRYVGGKLQAERKETLGW